MAYKVTVDAGHGGEYPNGDPGAVSEKYHEADANLAIAKKVQKKLKAAGYSVKMTRTKDKNVTLKERCRISNEFDSDLFISIHLNSSGNPAANGIETLRYPRVGQRTKDLTNNVQTELVAALGWRDRGVKTRSDLYVLKHTATSACLIECGFISNSAERKKLFTDKWQEKIAKAIVKAVEKTLKN